MNLSRPAPHQLFAPESQTSSGGGLAVCGGIDTTRTTPGNSSSVLAGPPQFLADNRSTPNLARPITAEPGTPPVRGFSVSPIGAPEVLKRCAVASFTMRTTSGCCPSPSILIDPPRLPFFQPPGICIRIGVCLLLRDDMLLPVRLYSYPQQVSS
jgi:hypothetical protein